MISGEVKRDTVFHTLITLIESIAEKDLSFWYSENVVHVEILIYGL